MVDIRPIKSTQDYERALARVDELMDPVAETVDHGRRPKLPTKP